MKSFTYRHPGQTYEYGFIPCPYCQRHTEPHVHDIVLTDAIPIGSPMLIPPHMDPWNTSNDKSS
jgi:hypothetical protein